MSEVPFILPDDPKLLELADRMGVPYVTYQPEPKGGSAATIMANINRRLRGDS